MERDLQKLAKLITLPRPPQDVWWQTVQAGEPGFGSTDWSLVAVLQFDPEDLRAILTESPLLPEGDVPTLNRALLFGGSPEVFQSRLVEVGPGLFRLPSPARGPDLFVRSPLLDGYLVPVTEDTVFLLLSTS